MSVVHDERNESSGTSIEYDDDDNSVESLQLDQVNFKSVIINHATKESINNLKVPSVQVEALQSLIDW